MKEEKKNVENVQGKMQEVNKKSKGKKTPKTHEKMFAGGVTD